MLRPPCVQPGTPASAGLLRPTFPMARPLCSATPHSEASAAPFGFARQCQMPDIVGTSRAGHGCSSACAWASERGQPHPCQKVAVGASFGRSRALQCPASRRPGS